MSLVPPELNPNLLPLPVSQEPNEVAPDETSHASHQASHFNFPGSDIVLRSRDTFDFPLPKLNIVICSPVLQNLIQSVSNSSYVPTGEEPLPVVNIPESKEILYSLLTFIFPVTPTLPPTTQKIMELLGVAQKYEMKSIVSHIRGAIALQEPPFLRLETAFHIYFLAQQYGLHRAAVRAARVTLCFPMTLESLGDKLDFPGMTGAYLHELWKYHKHVRTELEPALLEFRNSGFPDDVKDLTCLQRAKHGDMWGFPYWLCDYVDSIVDSPHLFDFTEFEAAWARYIHDHARHRTSYGACTCLRIPNRVKLTFWEALTDVVHRTIEKADSALTLVEVKEEPRFESWDLPSVPLCLDLPDANIIVRSSDQACFRLNKSVLAVSSPFFKDLLSLPQPPDGEIVDGLPVIPFPEDAGLLNSLISLLYPIDPVIPGSYQKVFALLAVCQKYEMESVQSNIRSAINDGKFPSPVGAEGFNAYVLASEMGLVPEAEDAARLTLDLPMTFESLGEGLRSFKGRTLCNLIHYHVENTQYSEDEDESDQESDYDSPWWG